MDINYLLCREQISLMRAEAAKSVEARRSHEGLARAYRARLQALHALHANTETAAKPSPTL
jgi:hypothetical protein